MGFGIASDVLLVAVLWTGAGVVAVSVGLLAAVAAARLGLVRRLARERSFVTVWEPLLVECVAAVPVAVPPLAPRDAELFLRLWSRIHDAVRGVAQERLNELARRTGCDRVAREFLASRNLRRRLIAVLALGQLREAAALPQLEAVLADPRPGLSLVAAQALLRIDPAAMLARVLAAAGQREDWAAARLVSMLREVDAAQVSAALAEAIDRVAHGAAAQAQVVRLLKLASTAHGEILRPAVLRVLERADNPEAIAAALAALQHPDDVQLARHCTGHSDAIVRLQAVKALARLGVREDVDRLVALLSDTSWWVRYRSAQALVASPWLSRDELERLRASLADRFAVDMLGQALAEPR